MAKTRRWLRHAGEGSASLAKDNWLTLSETGQPNRGGSLCKIQPTSDTACRLTMRSPRVLSCAVGFDAGQASDLGCLILSGRAVGCYGRRSASRCEAFRRGAADTGPSYRDSPNYGDDLGDCRDVFHSGYRAADRYGLNWLLPSVVRQSSAN